MKNVIQFDAKGKDVIKYLENGTKNKDMTISMHSSKSFKVFRKGELIVLKYDIGQTDEDLYSISFPLSNVYLLDNTQNEERVMNLQRTLSDYKTLGIYGGVINTYRRHVLSVINTPSKELIDSFLEDEELIDYYIITNCEPNVIDSKLSRMEYLITKIELLESKISKDKDLDEIDELNKEYSRLSDIVEDLLKDKYILIIKDRKQI